MKLIIPYALCQWTGECWRLIVSLRKGNAGNRVMGILVFGGGLAIANWTAALSCPFYFASLPAFVATNCLLA